MPAGNRKKGVGRGARRIAGMLVLASLAWIGWQLVPRDGVFESRRGILQGARTVSEPVPGGGYLSEAVSLESTSGLRVNFRVLRPAAGATQRATVLILGGHRTGRDAVDLVGNPGQVAVVAMDYPYSGPERPRGIRQSVGMIPEVREALLDTPAAALLVLDWLAGQDWVDKDRIEIVGASLGGPFAVIAGAHDARFRRVWVIHAGSDLRQWLEHNLESRIANGPLRKLAAGLLYVLARGPSLEPGRWIGRISPRAVVIVGAREDERLPSALVSELHETAGPASELIWMEGGHVNPDEREIVGELLGLVRSRLEAASAVP